MMELSQRKAHFSRPLADIQYETRACYFFVPLSCWAILTCVLVPFTRGEDRHSSTSPRSSNTERPQTK